MKFDIVRAWKDEAYRQSLSEEELKALPACPAGELSDLELAAVAGGGGFEGGNDFNEDEFGLGASSSSAASSRHFHSLAVIICDLNIFSNDVGIVALQNVLNIGSPRHEFCAHAG